jgi:hypothetical protein
MLNGRQHPVYRQITDPPIITEVPHLVTIQEKIVSLFPGEELSNDPAEKVRTELLGYRPGQPYEVGHGLNAILGYGHQVGTGAGPDHHLAGLDQYPGPGIMFHWSSGNVADGFEFL